MIILALVIPIVGVIAILKYSQKKHKKRFSDKTSLYLGQVLDGAGLSADFQKQLAHQLIALDEKKRTLLILSHTNATFSHEIVPLTEVREIRLFQQKEILAAEAEGRKGETLVTQSGLELSLGKQGPKRLVFYDHVEHNIYQMADLEKEARQLLERISRFKTREPVPA